MVDKCLYLIFDWVARSEMGSVILKKRGDNSILAENRITKYEFYKNFKRMDFLAHPS